MIEAPEYLLLSYTLGSILSPESWASTNRRKGMRHTTIESLNHRKFNRYNLRELVNANKSHFKLNTPDSCVAIKVLGLLNPGSRESYVTLKCNESGKYRKYIFHFYVPLVYLDWDNYLAKDENDQIVLVRRKEGLAEICAPTSDQLSLLPN